MPSMERGTCDTPHSAKPTVEERWGAEQREREPKLLILRSGCGGYNFQKGQGEEQPTVGRRKSLSQIGNSTKKMAFTGFSKMEELLKKMQPVSQGKKGHEAINGRGKSQNAHLP